MVIKNNDGNVFSTLVFNNNGQLQSTAFNVPARNNAPQQAQSTGFSFTITGLESGTSYDLTITSKDNNSDTLDTKTCSFTTTDTATGVDQVTKYLAQRNKSGGSMNESPVCYDCKPYFTTKALQIIELRK